MGIGCYNVGSNKTAPTEVFTHLNRSLTDAPATNRRPAVTHPTERPASAHRALDAEDGASL